MYASIVKQKVRAVFADLSRQDPEAMLGTLAPSFTYRFLGDTALGGTRTSQATMREWWARVFRLFPGATFTVKDVVVDGWPWSTNVATRVTLEAPNAGGAPYSNEFLQLMHLRFGKATRIVTIEDSQRLQAKLDEMAAAGVAEAGAAPIEDEAPAVFDRT